MYREGPELRFDLYRPRDDEPAAPCVIFVHGDGPPEVVANAKGWGQYTSWGRLAVASGLAAVTFNHRSTEGRTKLVDAADDVDRLIAFVRSNGSGLGVDPERLGLWVCSMGPPVALRTVLRARPAAVRCIAVLYGAMDLRPLRADTPVHVSDRLLEEFSPVAHLAEPVAAFPPMLLARAGLEDRPWLNPTIDAFVTAALAANVELDLLHHPAGRHGFDILDDDERSRDIVARTLAFLRRHLLSAERP